MEDLTVSGADPAASPELPPDAAAATRPPSEPSGTVPAPSAANGGAAGRAPLTLAELRALPSLTPAQKARVRRLEQAERAAARKAKRAPKAAPSAPAEAPAPAAPQVADDDDRDDAQREREVGAFWRLVLRVVSWCAMPFGYELDKLTPAEAREDAALLTPLARRHRWLDTLARYAALPVLLAERVEGKLRKRTPKAKAPTP